jgi:F-type H+-transporting ATPase subunit g
VHYLAVAREIAKQVYINERLTPPSPGDFAPAWRIVIDRFRDGNWWKEQFASGQWKTLLGMFAEVFFLYKIGEMLGRANLVGCACDSCRLLVTRRTNTAA